jgi:Trk K+ transport system NAD-binding subunit
MIQTRWRSVWRRTTSPYSVRPPTTVFSKRPASGEQRASSLRSTRTPPTSSSCSRPARSTRASTSSPAKLEIAGADRTLSPYAVGGRRLASLATQPLIVDFLDVVTRGEKGIEFRLEEFGVPKDSPLANHTIAALQIGEKTEAMVLAIRTSEGRFDTTPFAQDVIRTGDTLIVLGARDQVDRLEALLRGEVPADETPG